ADRKQRREPARVGRGAAAGPGNPGRRRGPRQPDQGRHRDQGRQDPHRRAVLSPGSARSTAASVLVSPAAMSHRWTRAALALAVSGHAFQVRSRALVFGGFRSRAMWILLGSAVYAVGGCWLVELKYAHSHSLARALQEALYQMWGIGSPALTVSRRHRVVSWFLGSISLIGFTA